MAPGVPGVVFTVLPAGLVVVLGIVLGVVLGIVLVVPAPVPVAPGVPVVVLGVVLGLVLVGGHGLAPRVDVVVLVVPVEPDDGLGEVEGLFVLEIVPLPPGVVPVPVVEVDDVMHGLVIVGLD